MTYVTINELKSLTGGKSRKTVLRWLQEKSWTYALGLDGWPRVLRKYHDAKLSGESPARATPNWRKAA